MQWWLTVFFLFGNSWISGDHFDGWSSRAYSDHAQCEERRHFAQVHTDRYPLTHLARWVCNPGRPAMELPVHEVSSSGALTADLAKPPGEERPCRGLDVFTSRELSWIAKDSVGLRYSGTIAPPLADELRKLLLSEPRRFNHVVLELDSCGGDLDHVQQVTAVLAEVRASMELTTRVMEGGVCASGCIPVFLQGSKRKASGASVWVFHGAHAARTNIPDSAATARYLDLLTQSGMAVGFREVLEKDNRIYRPGNLILSGYELSEIYRANIITELLPAWREESPILPPAPVPR